MSDDSDEPMQAPVTAERPDSAMHTTGTDHITLIGSNEADTIEFYRDILGMPLVLRQPNLDDPSQTHLFFDTGDGRIITFFVKPDRTSDPRPQQTGIGAVHHIAFKFDPDRYRDVAQALEDNGIQYSQFDRGIFQSLYTRDHNGLTLELTTDVFEIPDDRRGEVLATAQRIREEEGADYADEHHLEAALEELDIDVKRNDLPEASSGAGGL